MAAAGAMTVEEGVALLLADLAALHADAECPLNDFTLISDTGLHIKVLHTEYRQWAMFENFLCMLYFFQ